MRLIDADDLQKELKERIFTEEAPSVVLTPTGQEIFNSGIESAIFAVSEAETIDAVPVVRCRDCKWRFTPHCPMFHEEQTYNEDDGYEWVDHDHTSDDGFCNEGEHLDEILMDEEE